MSSGQGDDVRRTTDPALAWSVVEEKALEYRCPEDPENADDVDPVGELRERPES